jgi:hypothetical protein
VLLSQNIACESTPISFLFTHTICTSSGINIFSRKFTNANAPLRTMKLGSDGNIILLNSVDQGTLFESNAPAPISRIPYSSKSAGVKSNFLCQGPDGPNINLDLSISNILNF